MAKDPDQRYATTVELANAAHDAITTPIPRPVRPTEPTQPVQHPPPDATISAHPRSRPIMSPAAHTAPAWHPGYPIQKPPASGENRLALASLVASLVGVAALIIVLIIWLVAF